MTDTTRPNRRDFIKTTGAALIIGFTVSGNQRFAMAVTPEAGAPFAPNAFLRIGADDTVNVVLAHSEMGQGIWTTLPMLVAEELDCDWAKIKVEHAPAAPAYFNQVFKMQGTGGSTTTWAEFDRYRQAGAAARVMLLEAASTRLGVPVSQLRTENGVVSGGGKTVRYGELADAASRLKAPDLAKVKLKDAKEWRIIGKPTKRLDSPEKITGQAKFGIDIQFDGLLTALVAHPPVFGATVKAFDASAAKAVPGVRNVVQIPSGVAVVADHYWAAKLGRDALKVEWDRGPNAKLDSDQLHKEWTILAGSAGAVAAKKGDVDKAFAGAVKTVEAIYEVPYLAHAPMEPLNCTVKVGDNACEIWLGTQFQTVDQNTAASILGLKPEQVTIHTPFLGGGFGRRATFLPDMVFEAVHVAKAAGAPVKTVWTREDDIKGGFYRSAFLHKAKVGLDSAGQPMAFDAVSVGQSIMAGTPFEAMMVKNGVDETSIEGIHDSPYVEAIGSHRVSLHSPRTGIPVLWWRSVGHSHTAFAMESLIDELAHEAGKDPVDYRRSLLTKAPRHLGVLNLAVEKAGWGSPLPEGHARGVAVHSSFGSFIAQIAEVSLKNGQVRVHRVVCAVDCGVAINPAGIAAQMESGIAFGLGAALHSHITFKDGEVQESNFHDYQVLRMNEMPVVETFIVPSSEKSGGCGEPGTAPIAPAVANALFALTKKRLRQLPLNMEALV